MLGDSNLSKDRAVEILKLAARKGLDMDHYEQVLTGGSALLEPGEIPELVEKFVNGLLAEVAQEAKDEVLQKAIDSHPEEETGVTVDTGVGEIIEYWCPRCRESYPCQAVVTAARLMHGGDQ